MTTATEPDQPVARTALQFAPVVWMLGKVQSGKTSIVRELTQSSHAEIGEGFRACTKSARVFDFPQQVPVMRFLDTRGLGEAAYDPSEDIQFCDERTHLILAVVKALDTDQRVVLDVLWTVRARHPDWPIVVAQTSLHEAYKAGEGHILPYPFQGNAEDGPESLLRALEYQRILFRAFPGSAPITFVPIDFTQPSDGIVPTNYGRNALIDALIDAAPSAMAIALRELPKPGSDENARKTNAHILGFALAAGASDTVPAAGAVAVPMIQAAMLRQLAKLQQVHWDKRAYAEFASALGTGTLARLASNFGVRQLVKLIPVYGQTVGATLAAATSFAATYAIGKAASYFLTQRRLGRQVDDVAAVYQSALRKAFDLAEEHNLGTGAAKAKP